MFVLGSSSEGVARLLPESNLIGGGVMRQALIEKASGRMYLSPDAGIIMQLTAARQNSYLMLVGEDEFEDTFEARKVSLLITSYNTVCGAFFQVVIEERGAVVYAETFESYWLAYKAWHEWSGIWNGYVESFFTSVVKIDEITTY